MLVEWTIDRLLCNETMLDRLQKKDKILHEGNLLGDGMRSIKNPRLNNLLEVFAQTALCIIYIIEYQMY